MVLTSHTQLTDVKRNYGRPADLEGLPAGNLAGPGGVGVGDDHGIDGGKPGQDPGVECADPPRSGKPDSHGFASGVTGWPGYP